MTEAQIIQMLTIGREDLAWFEANIETLKSKYNNKFIAFCGKEILSYDSDIESLLYKLRQKGIDTSNIFIKFVSRVKSIL